MRKFLCFLAAIVLWGQLFAQNRVITGKVTDNAGKPLSDVSVVARPSGGGTATNASGQFTLTITAATRSLEFSSINFGTQTVTIGNRTTIDVKLDASNSNLSEVVVVGFGARQTREVTGSISKVSGDKVAAIPLPSFDQALAGKTAGVQINATGGVLGDGVAIRVRGINSITNSSQPLVVIDGVPQIAITNTNGFNGGDGTRFNPLALLNPNDIESIEVLKDAGSAVIYGSRAANGVILITTKKGKKGTARISLDIKQGFSKPTNLPQVLNGDQFIQISNEKASNRYGVGTANAVIAKENDIDQNGQNDRTDWMDALYRTAMTKDYSLSMSGGADKVSYYASARYLDQEGISYGNRLKTGQARLNLEMTPKDWFKSGMEIAYSKTMNYGILSDRYSAGSTVGWQAFPNVAIYNPSGPKGYNLRTTTPIGVMDYGNNVRSAVTGNFTMYNPIAAVDLTRQNNTAEDFKANAYAEVQPIRGLRFTTKFGIQNIRNFEDQYTSPFLAGLGNPYNGLVQDQDQQWRTWDWQNYASYDHTFATKHKVAVIVGSEYQKNDYFYIYTGAANFSDPFFQYIIDGAYTNVQPGTTTTLNLTGGSKTSSGLESYFSRLSYSFASKYFVEGSVRRDSYSGFGIDNRWGTFPSISAGWEITKETFFPKINHVDYVKIRGSYGTVGNYRGIGEYASRTLYGGASYTVSTGLGLFQPGVSTLQWESSKKTDIGIDANFYAGRLGIVIDYFKNNINKLVLDAPVVATVGVPYTYNSGRSAITTNIGGMYNRGFEFTVNATPITGKDFTWTSSLNYTTIKNKVTGLVPSNNNADIDAGLNKARVGEVLGTYFLPVWAGVDPATGNPRWYAADGSIKQYNFGAPAATLWTNDKGAPVAALGTGDYVFQKGKTGLPTWYGGWDNNFTYKNVDLGVSMIYQGGNYLYNNTRSIFLSNSFVNNGTEILNRWTKPGDQTDVARLYLLDNQANVASTRFLEKGDYLRVRTITLGYNVSKSLMSRIGFQGIRVYGQVFNAFTFTNYSGADPEVNTNRFSNIAVGLDLRNVPQPRTFTFGLQANF